MSPKELIKPRFEVIADYPKSIFKIGEIIENGNEFSYYTDYPHLFKKLNWWENRKENEMPSYLKHRLDITSQNWTYDKIESWDMKILVGWVNEKERTGCSLLAWAPEYGYFPAKKEDYENYKKTT